MNAQWFIKFIYYKVEIFFVMQYPCCHIFWNTILYCHQNTPKIIRVQECYIATIHMFFFSFVERAADLGKQTCYRTNVHAKQASSMRHGRYSQVNICCKNLTATAVCKFAIKNMVLCFETDRDSSKNTNKIPVHQVLILIIFFQIKVHFGPDTK